MCGCFSHALLGTCPTTQACVLTGIQTGNLLVRRLALNPLSCTSQGHYSVLVFSLAYEYNNTDLEGFEYSFSQIHKRAL